MNINGLLMSLIGDEVEIFIRNAINAENFLMPGHFQRVNVNGLALINVTGEVGSCDALIFCRLVVWIE